MPVHRARGEKLPEKQAPGRPLPLPRDPDPEEAQTPANTGPDLFSPERGETYADACRSADQDNEPQERDEWEEAMELERQEIARLVAARNRKRPPPPRANTG